MNRCLTGAAFVSWTLAAPAKPRTTNPNQHPATAADTSAYGSGSIPKMLSRMDPSSPPVKRTLHLLKTPDILLANDTAHPSITTWSLTGCPLGHRRLESIGWLSCGHSIGKVSLGCIPHVQQLLFGPVPPLGSPAGKNSSAGISWGTCDGDH